MQPATCRRGPIAAIIMAVALCNLSLPAARAAMPVLNQVPEHSPIVLVVPNMAWLNDQIAALASSIGLPQGELENILGPFKQHTGMTKGVDDDGAMILALSDVATGSPTCTWMVAVADGPAMLAGLGGNAAETTTQITLPQGNVGYARIVDGFAVMSSDQAALAAYAPGNKADDIAKNLGKLASPYLDDADVAIYIDTAQLSEISSEQLELLLTRIMSNSPGAWGAGGTGGRATGMEALQIPTDIAAEGIKELLSHTTGLIIAMAITPAAINFTVALQYKPDSGLDRLFTSPGADRSSTTARLLAKLPEQPMLLAAAIDTTAIDLTAMMQDVAGHTQEDPEIQAAITAALGLMGQTTAAATVLYAPDQTSMMRGSLLNGIKILEVQDAKQYVRDMKAFLLSLNGLTLPKGGGAAASPLVATVSSRITATYTDNALQLGDVQVDEYALNVNLPPEARQQLVQMGMMLSMVSGTNGYVVTKGNHVLLTTIPDPQLLQTGLAALDAAAGIGAAGAISHHRDEALPPGTVIEFYLGFDGLAQTINMFTVMMGMPPIVIPDELQPASVGIGAVDQGLAIRFSMPNETLRFVVDTLRPFLDLDASNGRHPSQQRQRQRGRPTGRGGAPPPPF
jgi:hypothetical protein